MPSALHLAGRQTIGTIVPDFSLPTLAGDERTLTSFLDGRRGAVVIFWSATCSHCARYDPTLDGFRDRHPELALVAVASRQQETPAQLRRSADERKLRFAILHDAERTVARLYEVAQTPKVFLLDPERRLIYRGAIDNFKYPEDPDYEPYLEPAIAAFLAGRPVPRPDTPSFGCPVASAFYQMPKPLRS